MKKLDRTLLYLALIAAVVMLALPTESVAAQAENPQLEEGRPDEEPKTLDELYADLLDRYVQAGERIENADGAVGRLERQIEILTEEGEDPAALQTILDNFLANMDLVRAAYEDLGELVDEHAGLDVAGRVTDESLAVSTLRQLAEGLLDLHQAGEDASFELRWDLMAYRYQNRQ